MKRLKNKGQSTIEFLLTFSLMFSFILFFYRSGLNYATGYLVHYATFMSSRAFLVFDDLNGDQNDRFKTSSYQKAEDVFEYILPSNAWINAENIELNYNPPNNINRVYVGVYADFTLKFSSSDFFGGKDPVPFRSESFLGKEPTKAECMRGVQNSMEQLCSGPDCVGAATFYDNGC